MHPQYNVNGVPSGGSIWKQLGSCQNLTRTMTESTVCCDIEFNFDAFQCRPSRCRLLLRRYNSSDSSSITCCISPASTPKQVALQCLHGTQSDRESGGMRCKSDPVQRQNVQCHGLIYPRWIACGAAEPSGSPGPGRRTF